jgi:hypothetical protein
VQKSLQIVSLVTAVAFSFATNASAQSAPPASTNQPDVPTLIRTIKTLQSQRDKAQDEAANWQTQDGIDADTARQAISERDTLKAQLAATTAELNKLKGKTDDTPAKPKADEKPAKE